MRKFLITFALFCGIFISTTAYAGDCFRDPIYDRDWNAVVTTGVYVRDVACMEGSEILTSLPVGTVIHVIAETDGWYKIETSDGLIGWVGQWLVEPTSQGFVTSGPLGDINGHRYEDAIRYIYDEGIVEGYPDGTYQPDRILNRAELLKIIVESAYNDNFDSYANQSCFTDVMANQWYTKYVCFGKEMGIVEGYSDDSFKPAQEINFVEALKITMIGFGYDFMKGDPWYANILEAAEDDDIVPPDVDEPGQDFSRSQMAEMIMRLLELQG